MPQIRTAILLVIISVAPATAQQARWWRPATAERAMVVSAAPQATQVGLDVLQRGGNAVDAAIAVHFALVVTLPYAGNIGGGGFLVYRQVDGSVRTYDYREAAPAAATETMYLDAAGEVLPGRPSWFGAKAVATPGSVAGMALVHERHGTLPWAELIEPAIRYAEEGFVVGPFLPRVIAAKESDIRRFPGAAEILLPGGRVPALGDTLRQPGLARTLRLIAAQGPDVFYRGEIADSIASAMEREGGLVTRDDLAAYEAKERPPITFEYRGHTIHSMGPPSSGGLTVKLILDQLETFDLARYGFHSAASIHRIAEAMRRAFAVRNATMGDSDYVSIPDSVASVALAEALAATIDTLAATSSDEIQFGPGLAEGGTETTHFSIVDPMGNAVASTTTPNGWFGSLSTAAGIFLNNEMDDFTVKPGIPNEYGLVQGRSNAIAGGKRPLSAMTPTIVERNGELRYVIGSPGGSTIITTVAQVLINTIDYGLTISEAVDAKRFHNQHLPDQIFVEPVGFSSDTIEKLEAMGHAIEPRRGYSGRAQGIEVEEGVLYGRADLRGGGQAAGF